MGNFAITLEKINAIAPTEIANDENVKQKFIEIYETIWGEGKGESAYAKEKYYFNRIVSDSAEIKNKCTRFSIFNAFLDIAVCGLSLEPGNKPLLYLRPRNYKIGVNQQNKPVYEGRCILEISGYGELALRARVGQIRYADNPVIMYEGDTFSAKVVSGQKVVDYECCIPRKSNKIIGAFIKIVRSDGSIDYSWMLEDEIERLKGYSAKANKKWDDNRRIYVEAANSLYSSQNGGIDSGFLGAKMIKHAFSAYPKIRIGRGTMLATEQEEDIDYGIANDVSEKNPEEQSERNAPFGDEVNNIGGGIKVEVNEQENGAF